MITTDAFERIQEVVHVERRNGDQLYARCPAHDDRRASLTITRADRYAGVMASCKRGCTWDDILAAINWTRDDARDEPRQQQQRRTTVCEYDYVDENGKVLYTKVRYDPKDFRQYHRANGQKVWSLNGTRRVLYRLPEVLNAKAAEQTIYLPEGEKDVHAIVNAGGVATTWSDGAWSPGSTPKWRSEYTEQLRDAHVIVIQDRDVAGRATAKDIADAIRPVAKRVKIVEAAEGKDASDHLQAGHTLSELVNWVEPSPRGTDSTPAELERRIRLTPMSAIKIRPVRWVWDERLPVGEVTLTPGRGGVGKSTFHAWVMANLSRGTLPGIHFGTPKPCIVAATEDSYEQTIAPRLLAAGADMDLVYRVDVVTESNDIVSVSFPNDINALIEEIKELGVALLSIDPVMSVMSSKLDSHKDRDVRLGLEPLRPLLDRTSCAVLGNAHFNKSTGPDPMALIMGSAAFGNVPRAVLGFAVDPDADDGSCVISQVKNNLGRLDLPSLRYRIDAALVDTDEGPAKVGRLVMLGESTRSVADILRDRNTDDDDRSERDEAAAWLIDYLTSNGGSAGAADAIKAAAGHGIAKTTLTRARTRAGVRSAKHGMTGGWVWTIEESTEETEESGIQRVDSTDSSVDSSCNEHRACAACGEPMLIVEAGQTTHPNCEEISAS
jgi:hypothetical protein